MLFSLKRGRVHGDMRNFSSFFFLHPLFLFLSLYQIGSEAENDYIHSRIQDVSSSEAPRFVLLFLCTSYRLEVYIGQSIPRCLHFQQC